MSMQRIRSYYSIPAKRGMRILFKGAPYIITGTTRGPMYIRVRPADGGRTFALHPTWEVEYPEAKA